MNVVATSISGRSVQMVVSDAGDQVVCVERSFAALEGLHASLVTACDSIPSFPLFPGMPTDAALTHLCAELNDYFAHGSVKASAELHALLADDLCHGTGHMTAIDFLLQPFEYEKVVIPRGSKHDVQLQVTNSSQVLVWKFEVEDFDIDFNADFHVPTPMYTEVFHATTRYQTTVKPVEGMYRCPKPGVLTLSWDNTYSRLRGKTVHFVAHVVEKSSMESALLAADALTHALQNGPTSNFLHKKALPTPTPMSSPALASLLPRYALSSMPSLDLNGHWLVSGLVSTTMATASKLFGSRPALPPAAAPPATKDGEPDSIGNSLMEELNGLNMQLLQRVESLEDALARLAVERDQALSRVQMATARHESEAAVSQEKDGRLEALQSEIDRLRRERQQWPAIQAERDALLLEKHRWAMIDEFDTYVDPQDDAGRGDVSPPSSPTSQKLSDDARMALEKELGQAEVALIRLRAQLGYSLQQVIPNTRIEQLAKDLAVAKTEYDAELIEHRNTIQDLNQQILKYRSHKKVLVTELRNVKRQTDGQVAVALAEAHEARMVNTRLKRQNELLLSQMRSLVDATAPVATPAPVDVPTTLTAQDLAMLNGEPYTPATAKATTATQRANLRPNPFREKLTAFFTEYDPAQLEHVEEMLESYRGVEASLLESLELKYRFQELNAAYQGELM
ncbi:hypothetical protein SPRG_03404 [Saprolegnia parasitica CBS 223.65]|uniref:GOLD domain-containing protein n=1 Tax=Saprolegnia parasitica (strain CBS 223.65) TaxID=695850 RepID=A0A067CZJ6_SAPPC|nr:hypothetical protein SPRG_03404 [Saprolegnia parasitica CBS 223.65]KDO32187.1 hypothetical protein SPRG_03404 [Saprolegnia parasitica CBS 223.65]|eukprot:XP_012197368.1 hypothetical protein SPRG_03404 [Saprolegnia parasitica CBS 223.65]